MKNCTWDWWWLSWMVFYISSKDDICPNLCFHFWLSEGFKSRLITYLKLQNIEKIKLHHSHFNLVLLTNSTFNSSCKNCVPGNCKKKIIIQRVMMYTNWVPTLKHISSLNRYMDSVNLVKWCYCLQIHKMKLCHQNDWKKTRLRHCGSEAALCSTERLMIDMTVNHSLLITEHRKTSWTQGPSQVSHQIRVTAVWTTWGERWH